MTSHRKLLNHAANYSIGRVFLLLASFISFPIFTRILSTSEYGLLNLVNSILVLSVTFSKFGISKAAARFYQEYKSNKRNSPISQYYSTLFFSTIIIGGSIGFVVMGVKLWIITSDNAKSISGLLVYVAILIPFACAFSVFSQFLRAEQRTTFYNLIQILLRYAGIGMSIFFVFYFVEGLNGFFFGRTVVESVVFLLITYVLYTKRRLAFQSISLRFLKECIKYGFPLIFFELTVNILAYGDRFLIAHYLGPEELGIYSAGYNLSMYCSNMFSTPFRMAILPIYMEVWTNEGKEQTKQFLSNAFNYYSMIAIPLIIGFSAIGRDIITLLASERYYQSYKIIPFVIGSLTIYRSYVIFAAGLYIYKKTYTLTIMFVIGCALNIVLNMLLIPRYGILGAAAATSTAYLMIFFLIVIFSFRVLRFKVLYGNVIRSTLCSVIMFIIILNIHTNYLLVDVIAKIVIGFFIYSVLILLFDLKLRKIIFATLKGSTPFFSSR